MPSSVHNSLHAIGTPDEDGNREELQVRRYRAALPRALRLLLDRAGSPSLREVEERIRARTGVQLSRSAVSLWLRGETSPTLDHLLPFLVALGLDPYDLAAALRDTVREADEERARELAA